jgi:hypothetical protein
MLMGWVVAICDEQNVPADMVRSVRPFGKTDANAFTLMRRAWSVGRFAECQPADRRLRGTVSDRAPAGRLVS